MFDCKKQRYVWDEEKSEFFKLPGLDKSITTAALHQQVGLSATQQFLRYVHCTNHITILRVDLVKTNFKVKQQVKNISLYLYFLLNRLSYLKIKIF